MFEVNYTSIPEYFIQKNDHKIILYKQQISIKWFLINKLKNCPNKTKLMTKMANEGILITIDGKTERVWNSFKWLKKLYYDNLRDNL
jgi:hypothetical protein